jgi:AcrR family transcriptional regulator
MKKAAKRSKAKSTRLAASDWVDAALATMARRGIANVRVERLARDLKVTKGSFYWHFKDRDALLDAMLMRYREISLTAGKLAVSQSSAAGDPMAELRAVLEAPTKSPDAAEGARMELAIRLWARRSERVHGLLLELDKARVDYVQKLLRAAGIDTARLRPLALLIQAQLFQLWTRDDLSGAERGNLVSMVLDIVKSSVARTREYRG